MTRTTGTIPVNPALYLSSSLRLCLQAYFFFCNNHVISILSILLLFWCWNFLIAFFSPLIFYLVSYSWIDAAKFLTGASAVGSLAIPIILRHAHMIETGAMFIEFTSFFIFVCTVMCFHRVSLEDDWWFMWNIHW